MFPPVNQAVVASVSSDVVTAPHHQKEAFANFKVNISHRATASRLYSTHPVVPSQLMPVVSQWTGKVRKNKHFFAVWIARTLAPRLPHMRMYILRAIYLPNPPISTPGLALNLALSEIARRDDDARNSACSLIC